MTVEEMKRIKEERGYSIVDISLFSGVPVGTVQKIFNGQTEKPRRATLQAIEKVFMGPEKIYRGKSYRYDEQSICTDPDTVAESAEYMAKKPGKAPGEYTLEDYYRLPDDIRVELIDGVFYDMATPTFLHQSVAGEVYRQIANYILERGGACQVIMSPFDVQLDRDEKTMVKPDVLIVCDPSKIVRRHVYGAPDFALEVLSPSTQKKDLTIKYKKYLEAGVREYWILDPVKGKVLVYFFEEDMLPTIYGVEEPIPVRIYGGRLSIDMQHIKTWIEQWKE